MNRNMNKHLKFMGTTAALAVVSLSTSSAAVDGAVASDAGFSDLYKVFVGWIGGSLGKIIALIGFAGTVVAYMMNQKGQTLVVGIFISLVAGGIPGIANTFFEFGNVFNEGLDVEIP